MNDKLTKHLSGFEKAYPRKLEAKYPGVVEKIVELWGTPKLSDYFHGLLIDQHGNWKALPEDVASEIVLLLSTYDKIQGTDSKVTAVSADARHAAKREVAPMALEAMAVEPRNKVVALSAMEKEEAKLELERLELEFVPNTMLKLAESNDPAPIMLFINAGMPVDVCDEKGWTSLMVASFKGNEAVADALIQYGANALARDRDGYTALHWAALNGYRDVVRLILSKGNESNTQSNHGWSALLQAAAMGHAAIAGDLLDAGANPNLASHDGWTPLHKAVANGHKEVVAVLLKFGASVVAQHKDGSTPLSLAQSTKNPVVLNMLLAKLKSGV